MSEDSPAQVTFLLRCWRDDDQAALDRLHRIAHRYMTRERPDRTRLAQKRMNGQRSA